ncbi:unnamed protein product [Phytophthora fragariaefolia]|uniref:Unnamed protein product n=1 Tax=Phytophthora fragariaefolia TaxID=1490495 RepID=A0A9W7CN08_9STRA|nr:unnamed protein product [Phytophthora fragariaefolia]
MEDILLENDTNSSGFVNLNQLCYILADQFDLKISEMRLIEVCMGMNFNAQAQLDYKEFVDVLMDILIYALPDIRESAKRKSLVRLDQYLQSGFPPGREGARQLLDALCSKYDLKGDQCISTADLVHVFHTDLVKQHALELPFPLEEHETIQLARPFIRHKTQRKLSEGFLSYPELLDAILGPFPLESNAQKATANQFKGALRWEFWRGIYMSLCGGDPLMEQKVLVQLGKIIAKLDSEAKFTISARYFKRIFEQHLSSYDMEVVIAALELDGTASDESKAEVLLRYDIFLKIVFGSPDLNDDHFFVNYIRKKLLRENDRLRAYMTEIMASKGASHKISLQDCYDIFVIQADEHPLTIAETLFLVGSVDSSHEGSVEVKVLKQFLSARCWSDDKCSKGNCKPKTDVDSFSGSCDVESIKKLVIKGCAAYDLPRVFDDASRISQGWLSQSTVVKKLVKMMHELGVVGIQQDDLKRFVQAISLETETKVARPPSRDDIHYDAFFDALFDWDTMISDMSLPQSLVEVKKVFEKFDWEYVGSIRCDDWNKAYRVICRSQQGMPEWQVDVLHRRFPGQGLQRERDRKIDYARLLVFLLDYQQRQARKSLQALVVQHFEKKFASAYRTVPTAEFDRLFRSLDTDNKGHFNAADLKTYLITEFERGTTTDISHEHIELLGNMDALSSVMRLLTGDKLGKSQSRSLDVSLKLPTIVTYERFREIANSFNSARKPLHPSALQGRRSDMSCDDDSDRSISSLRVLEITILEIASKFADRKGNILPTRAFRHLSLGYPPLDNEVSQLTSPSSPLRRSSLGVSPRNHTAGLSSMTKRKKRELQASTLDPLTPARLKQLLQIFHHVNVSTHLISQFFLHIGSPSKYFLDLLHFAQWVAPLSVELQVKVREVVRKMSVKGKAGGGRVDIDRFLSQLQRRLQDSPHYVANMGSLENSSLQFVSMPLLLSKLHQLNIPLHKQELLALLHHFGMEEDLEAVDYALFLHRLYELNTSMTSS